MIGAILTMDVMVGVPAMVLEPWVWIPVATVLVVFGWLAWYVDESRWIS